MAKLTSKTKFSFLFLAPVLFISLANAFVLSVTGHPKLLLANILILLGTLFFSKIFVQSFIDRFFKNLEEEQTNIEAIEFSIKMLNEELKKMSLSPEELQIWRKEINHIRNSLPDLSSRKMAPLLKNVLVMCLQEAEKSGASGKGHIAIAKQIAQIYSDANRIDSFENVVSAIEKINDKIWEGEKKLSDFERPLIIAEGIISKAERMNAGWQNMVSFRKVEKENSKSPFETAVIRKAIKRAEKKAA